MELFRVMPNKTVSLFQMLRLGILTTLASQRHYPAGNRASKSVLDTTLVFLVYIFKLVGFYYSADWLDTSYNITSHLYNNTKRSRLKCYLIQPILYKSRYILSIIFFFKGRRERLYNQIKYGNHSVFLHAQRCHYSAFIYLI